MKQHNIGIEENGRNYWNTARERERRRARYAIRRRVALGNCNHLECAPGKKLLSEIPTDSQELDIIIGQINEGDRSAFSLSVLDNHFELLSAPVPTSFLLMRLPEEKLVSWFGAHRFTFLKSYLNSLASVYLIEYTVLLGRFHILGTLLVGGINPCSRGIYRQGADYDIGLADSKIDRSLQDIGNKVLKRFFNRFPLPLSNYIVKRVVDMRLAAYESECGKGKDPHSFLCCVCEKNVPWNYGLVFKNVEPSNEDCDHEFCEMCFWNDILENVDLRWGDVALCPCCSRNSSEASLGKMCDTFFDQKNPGERYKESRRKFYELPIDTNALKHSKRKKKKVPDSQALASSWSAAVSPLLGLCQSVRRDKFLYHAERCSIPYVRGCLEAGVDINTVNEYGQTALYIASWKGDADMVKLLLSYGADPRIPPNGGSNIQKLCHVHGHQEVLDLVEAYLAMYRNESFAEGSHVAIENPRVDDFPKHVVVGPMHMETLIDPAVEHPGAGSYVIDNCFTNVECLVELWRSLPVDDSSAKTLKKQGMCADRSYFCDAEGWLRALLAKCILQAFQQCEHDFMNGSTPTVLPHMRFLHYSYPGSVLAPHIDLCRVDPFSGLRSSHSFLLYLTDCDEGGETVLLEDVKESIHLAKVKPKTGRLLLFPHDCPHEGAIIEDVPKLLIRGEVVLNLALKTKSKD